MKKYCVPFITSHDLSNFQLCRNQATCGSLLDGQNLAVNTDDGACGGATDTNEATICLSGSVPTDQLVGLVLVGSEGQQIQISSCVTVADPDCPGTQYDCTSAVDGFTTEQCILSIECDGQEIASCPIQTCSFN